MTILRTIRLPALAALVSLSAFACTTPSETTTEAAAVVSTPLSTGEILQTLQAINQGEIAQAQLALEKSQDPEVQAIARLLIEDHGALQQRVSQVAYLTKAELEESTLSRGVVMQAAEVEADLREVSGETFDRTFLAREAEMHEVALELVRDQLVPSARAPEVEQLLDDVATHLEKHLQAARARQQNADSQQGAETMPTIGTDS